MLIVVCFGAEVVTVQTGSELGAFGLSKMCEVALVRWRITVTATAANSIVCMAVSTGCRIHVTVFDYSGWRLDNSIS